MRKFATYILWILLVLALPVSAQRLSDFESELNAVAQSGIAATVRMEANNQDFCGVVISPDGHILTLSSAVEGLDSLTVLMPGGESVEGYIVSRWPLQGMALLKVDTGEDVAHLSLGDSRLVQPGDPVVSVGNAFSAARGRYMNCGVHYGIISGKKRLTQSGVYFDGEALLTDTRINTGSAGGPLLDAAGTLIGLNGVPLITHETNTHLSLALPVHLVEEALESYATTRLTTRLEDVLTLETHSHQTGGVEVLTVSPLARRADILPGDLIHALLPDATRCLEIQTPEDFHAAFSEAAPERLLPVYLYRNGRSLTRWLPLRPDAPLNAPLLGEIYRQAVARVAPLMVSIHVSRRGAGAELDPHLPGDQQVFQLGSGPFSGFVYREDGYILTSSFNLAGDVRGVMVEFPQGNRLPARILGSDLGRNITLLKVESKNLPSPMRAPAGRVRVGTTVLALGSTFAGYLPTIDRGIVSALNRGAGKAIQIDANLTPGNFGGPAIDLKGRVIGVNVPTPHRDAAANREGTAGGQLSGSGIGFVIPLKDIDDLFLDLKVDRDLEPAFLGIRFNSDSQLEGAEIMEVIQEVGFPREGITNAQLRRAQTLEALKKMHRMVPTGAAAAGLQPGDVIREFNGQRIPSWNVLLNSIGRLNAGEEVLFTIERLGSRRTVRAVLGPRGRVF